MLKKIKSFILENKTIRQTIAKNVFWLSVSNVGGKLIRAILIIYAARVLGAEGWGIFSYALTISATFSIFMDLGINPIVLKEISKENDDLTRKKILSTSLFLKIIFSIIGFFAIVFITPYFIKIEEVKKLLILVALILTFDMLRDFIFSLSRALQQMEKEALLFTITNISIVSFGLIFLKINSNVYSFALGYVVGTGIGSILSFIVFKNYFKGILKYFSPELIKKILFSGWPFALSGILSLFLTNTDILIIGWLKDAIQVGLYSAAVRIVALLYIIPGILTTALIPVFSKLAYHDDEKFKKILEQGLKLLFLFALPITFGGIILAGPIMQFIFGKEYLPAAPSFAILNLTILTNFSAGILINALFAYNKQKYLASYTAIGAILNVLLDIILIPPFGIFGSAWATFISQFISNFYLWLKMKKVNYFVVLPHLKKAFAATFFMTAIIYLLSLTNLNVIILIAIGIILYFGCLYLIKEPFFEEIKKTIKTV
jgi:O-antigen/teichoic acid export membrane protein